jgi:hypothetical protein
MSKNQTIKTIYKELDLLNDVIDMKIIKGLPYSKESRQHRYLTSTLLHAKREEEIHKSISFINKFSHMVSTFVL